MSYCRFNSNCDVYCFSDVGGGFTTMVAGGKFKDGYTYDDVDKLMELKLPTEEFQARYADMYTDIGEFDGREYNDPTFEVMVDRVKFLKENGYQVPDHLIERMEQIIASGEKQ